MQIIYNISINVYGLIIRFAALFNKKAKLWVEGRKNILEKIPNNTGKSMFINWFHCASLGEFEQGRPLIEKLKEKYPHEKIFVTFYSPSGYEIRKNYAFADWVSYLPLDRKKNMQEFIGKINPSRVFIIKYELWFNMLNVLTEKKTPTYLISGKFRKEQIFFASGGSWFFEKLRKAFTHFFVQDEVSKNLLQIHGIENSSIVGDTRIDRVMEHSKNPQKFPTLEKLLVGKKVIIGGSIWDKENEFLLQYKNKIDDDTIIILAPHEVNESRIKSLQKQWAESVLWSDIDQQNICPKIILINCIGILSSLYQYGNVAVIGGGFNASIHNILEPAAFGLPVLFGPKHYKFDEASAMINNGSGFCFEKFEKFSSSLNSILQSAELRTQIKENQLEYLNSQSGATEKILSLLLQI